VAVQYNCEVLSRRILKYLNLGIAAALVVFVGCAYWFAWRPLPETSGSLAAPVTAPATISRDSLGVPHVAAASEEDAWFLQGFVTAQDRLFQMDAIRRLASGELAEVVGKAALESDREARRLRLRRLAEQHARELTAADTAVFAAYARGVNFYIEQNRGRLPLEFTLLRYDPRPWTVADSLAAAMQLTYTLTKSWKTEAQRAEMLKGGDRDKIEFLFPVRAGGDVRPGSNAWAVSGSLTASGHPILASDPHLEYSLPSAWYMIHLKAPGLNVTGVSLPGLPGVLIGHNDRIAWGATNLQFDVMDLYDERLEAATGRYLFQGRAEQAAFERELIRVKGERHVEAGNWITRHGWSFRPSGAYFESLRWIAAEKGQFHYPFPDVNRARDWREFRAALARYPGPAQNFVYADIDGNIGYQAAGKLPIRKNYQGNLPADGVSGQQEWAGFIPFEQLPYVHNPASGMIVSANQNPFPAGYPYRVSGNFASPYRARQIRTRLGSRRGWKPEEMLALQTDVYSAVHHFLAREVAAAHARRGIGGGEMTAAVNLLRDWDGQLRTGAAAPMIATLLYEHLLRAIVERAAPGKGTLYEFESAPAVVETLIRSRSSDWFGDYDQLLLRSLAAALEEGRRTQGRDVTKWDYGRYHRLFLPNPVIGRLPLIGRYFNIGPVPMSGGPTTVKQILRARFLGPSMRMVVDFSDLDRSFQNITTGQSGQVLSSHYRDQWRAYYTGSSFPMQFLKVDAKDVLAVVPETP
jgi:penicillin amidase